MTKCPNDSLVLIKVSTILNGVFKLHCSMCGFKAIERNGDVFVEDYGKTRKTKTGAIKKQSRWGRDTTGGE